MTNGSIVMSWKVSAVSVAQICNLLYRRIEFGYASPGQEITAGPVVTGRLEIRDTADPNHSFFKLTCE
jgi:hypothetical protein